MDNTLRVGIIGASAAGGWARESHVPAVQHLAGLTLQAVATTSQPSADAAARAFGALKAYDNPQALFQDPDIDVVTVAVRVPAHRDLVLAAVKAGKHVVCEWPLGINLTEAEELAEAARAAGVHTAIGLQTRMNPAAHKARQLIAAGAIGRVLSANVLSTTMAFGPKVDPGYAFAEDAAKGVTLVTVQAAHTLDFVIATLGEFSQAAAMVTTQFPQVTIGDDPTPHARSTPDHILVQARLAAGPAVSVEVAGGRPADATPFRFEVVGEAGILVLDGGAPRGFQSGRLRLSLNGQPQPVEEQELAGLPDPTVNVAGVYAALRDDINSGTFTVPDFDHAVHLTRLIEDMLASDATGGRRPGPAWPRR